MLQARPLQRPEDATVLPHVCSKFFAPFFLRQPEACPPLERKDQSEKQTRLTAAVEAFPRCVEPLLFGTWFSRDINLKSTQGLRDSSSLVCCRISSRLSHREGSQPLSVTVPGQLLKHSAEIPRVHSFLHAFLAFSLNLAEQVDATFSRMQMECHQVKTSTAAQICSTRLGLRVQNATH